LGLLSSGAELNDYYWADEIKEDKWVGHITHMRKEI